MEIRAASSDDAPAIYEVVQTTSESMPWDDEDECRAYLAWLGQRDAMAVVAEIRGEVTGWAALWWGEDIPEYGRSLDISMIDVHPKYQGKGIGAKLVRHAMELAREIHCATVSVWPSEEAVGFYNKLGFCESLKLLRVVICPSDVDRVPEMSLAPIALKGIAPPKGCWLGTQRLVHPLQRWHDLVREQAEPVSKWPSDDLGGSVLSYALSDQTVEAGFQGAIYRRMAWKRDLAKAEMYLWLAEADRTKTLACAAFASSLGIDGLEVLAWGQMADWLVAVGGEIKGSINLLTRPIV